MTNFHVGQKTRSVRRTLVDWLQRIIDHLTQDLVQDLGGCQVHSNARRDIRDGLIVGVKNSRGHGDVDVAVEMPQLGKEVDKVAGTAVISNGPRLLSDQNFPAGLHNDFVNHQQGSYPNVANLNQHATTIFAEGVRNNEQLMQLQAERLRGLFPKKSSGGGK